MSSNRPEDRIAARLYERVARSVAPVEQLRRLHRVRRRERVLVFASAVALLAVVIGLPILWLGRGGTPIHYGTTAPTGVPPGVTTSTTPPTTTDTSVSVQTSSPPTTQPVVGEEQDWVTLGESIPDEEFLAAVGSDVRLVPGSARRLAWTDAYDGRYSLGLFVAQVVEDENPWKYCLWEFGAVIGHGSAQLGGSICVRTMDRFTELLLFGITGSASCAEPLKMVTVWGISHGTQYVYFDLTDGTRLVAEVRDGVAQAAWGRDVQVKAVDFEGATPSQLAQLQERVDANQGSCADMNNPDLPG